MGRVFSSDLEDLFPALPQTACVTGKERLFQNCKNKYTEECEVLFKCYGNQDHISVIDR